jgi:hypothetical protein
MERFDIYFFGETLPTADSTAVREGVGRLFKLQGAAVDRLFSGKPLRVKKDVDVDAASRYRAAFREIGALIQIVPAGTSPAAPAASRSAPADDHGGAAEPAPAAAPIAPGPSPTSRRPAQAPDDDQATLARSLTLTIVEETFPDEDSLPRSAVGHAPAMTLAEPGATIDDTPPALPAAIDTRGLEALPPNTGSLADCRAEKPPRPIPDISHLRLVDD